MRKRLKALSPPSGRLDCSPAGGVDHGPAAGVDEELAAWWEAALQDDDACAVDVDLAAEVRCRSQILALLSTRRALAAARGEDYLPTDVEVAAEAGAVHDSDYDLWEDEQEEELSGVDVEACSSPDGFDAHAEADIAEHFRLRAVVRSAAGENGAAGHSLVRRWRISHDVEEAGGRCDSREEEDEEVSPSPARAVARAPPCLGHRPGHPPRGMK